MEYTEHYMFQLSINVVRGDNSEGYAALDDFTFWSAPTGVETYEL